ncbi:MAG TPA: hemerythrin domain-containing protein [Noviherbaspirillum sp.]|uniref:hemerythrin domain-containing protein n=1 Tax=Noviherbaspirillum sp. TaxID=1926288 RepID=UPI002D361E3B|nr:hemerythrin domain-containing protein [Noviherbaspirillum sp.]HYD93808.1 hemerythrin domain-containing protein [Noviherbaspirillum sp.]
MHENRGAFPVDRPVEALLRDHSMVRKLAEAYRNSQSMDARKEAATKILQMLETHSRLEESVFYPAVRDIDASMVGHFEQEHQKTDDLLQSLQSMPMDDPQAEQMMGQLLDMTLHHIQEEEDEFFPKLEQASMDMTQIGLQMQAFEANLVHAQAQGSQPGAQQ